MELVAEVLLITIVAGLATVSYYVASDIIQTSSSMEGMASYINILPIRIDDASWYDYKDGLILYYSFDDLNGTTVIDESGNRKDGFLHDDTCHTFVEQNNGHYYEYFSYGCEDLITEKPGWPELYNYCKSVGAWMAVPQDEAENNYLFNRFGRIWLGVYQDPDDLSDNNGYPEGCPGNEPSGCWKSVPEEPTSYRNWGEYEPNNAGGIENCAHLGPKWNDNHCMRDFSFVCESDHLLTEKNINGVIRYPKQVDGIVGKALHFDGVDDFASTPEINLGNGPFTIVFYYKVLSRDLLFWDKENPSLIHTLEGCFYRGYLNIATYYDRGLTVGTRSADTDEYFGLVYDSGEYYVDRWIFGSVERNGDEWSIYLNGRRVDTEIDNRSGKLVCYRFGIGLETHWGFTTGVDRYVDEFRIYNRPLGKDIIQNLYYRIHMLIYNPNNIEINLDGADVVIGGCVINLEYNRNYITDLNSPILSAHGYTMLKVSPIDCHLRRGYQNVCLQYGAARSCSMIEVK